MKRLVLLVLIVTLTIGSYAQEKKSPLEGTWRCVSMGSQKLTDNSFQAMIKNGTIKTFSKEYFTFIGHFDQDTISPDVYGAGTYTLNGNRYEETIMYHNIKPLIGGKFKAVDEIRNDTLFHSYNNNADSWELGGNFFTEKYVRLK
ncbi:MAG: hypothetical protein ABR927_16185 [Bacteroidales bacterium]|jgi:hypothetical protein